MAYYRVLYWKHIPLGIKATDANGSVRANLSARFLEALEDETSRSGQTDTLADISLYKWGKKQVREGTAAEVAAAIAKELDETWTEAMALASVE